MSASSPSENRTPRSGDRTHHPTTDDSAYREEDSAAPSSVVKPRGAFRAGKRPSDQPESDTLRRSGHSVTLDGVPSPAQHHSSTARVLSVHSSTSADETSRLRSAKSETQRFLSPKQFNEMGRGDVFDMRHDSGEFPDGSDPLNVRGTNNTTVPVVSPRTATEDSLRKTKRHELLDPLDPHQLRRVSSPSCRRGSTRADSEQASPLNTVSEINPPPPESVEEGPRQLNLHCKLPKVMVRQRVPPMTRDVLRPRRRGKPLAALLFSSGCGSTMPSLVSGMCSDSANVTSRNLGATSSLTLHTSSQPSTSTALISMSQLPNVGVKLSRPGGVLDRNGVSLTGNALVDAWIHSQADARTVTIMSKKHPVVRRLSTLDHLHNGDEASTLEGVTFSKLLETRGNKRNRTCSTSILRSRHPDGFTIPKDGASQTYVHPLISVYAIEEVARSRKMELTDYPSKEFRDNRAVVPHSQSELHLSKDPTLLLTASKNISVEKMTEEDQLRPWRGRQWQEAALLTKRWRRDVQAERRSSEIALELLVQLYHQVILGHKHHHLFATDDNQRFAVLATRAAVCCVLIEKILSSLTRHQASLTPYVDILFQHLLVPNTSEMTIALGTVEYLTVLQGLGLDIGDSANGTFPVMQDLLSENSLSDAQKMEEEERQALLAALAVGEESAVPSSVREVAQVVPSSTEEMITSSSTAIPKEGFLQKVGEADAIIRGDFKGNFRSLTEGVSGSENTSNNGTFGPGNSSARFFSGSRTPWGRKERKVVLVGEVPLNDGSEDGNAITTTLSEVQEDEGGCVSTANESTTSSNAKEGPALLSDGTTSPEMREGDQTLPHNSHKPAFQPQPPLVEKNRLEKRRLHSISLMVASDSVLSQNGTETAEISALVEEEIENAATVGNGRVGDASAKNSLNTDSAGTTSNFGNFRVPQGMTGFGGTAVSTDKNRFGDTFEEENNIFGGIPLANIAEVIHNATPEILMALLRPFCRKPFFLAHMEISRKAVLLGHQVRSRQLHFNQLAKIFNFTYMHWSKSLLMTVLRAWYKLCIERRTKEQKKRQQWARRHMVECLRVTVNMWRGYAIYKLQTSKKDQEVKGAIRGKREEIQQIRLDTTLLKEESARLDQQCHDVQESIRETEFVTITIMTKYTKTLEKVREMDRMGTMLLNTLLIKDKMPEITVIRSGNGDDTPPAPPPMVLPPPAAPHFRVVQLGSAESSASLLQDGEKSQGESVTEMPGEDQPVSIENSVGQLCSVTENPGLLRRTLSGVHSEMSMANLVIDASKKQQVAQQQQQLVMSLRILVMWANQKVSTEGRKVEDVMPDTGLNNTQMKNVGTIGSTRSQRILEEVEAQSPRKHLGEEPEMLMDAGGGEVAIPPFDQLLDEPNRLITIPVYKFLVLMRCFAPDNLNLPSISLIRTVKVEDEEVVQEIMCAQARLEAAGQPTGLDRKEIVGPHGEPTTTMETREVDIHMLSHIAQVKLHDLSKILLDTYEHLTSTSCPCSVEQLATRKRNYYVLYLAGLLRHYTHFVVRRLQRDLGVGRAPEGLQDDWEEEQAAAAMEPVAEAEKDVVLTPKSRKKLIHVNEDDKQALTLHRGQRHKKYRELTWPPEAHKTWRELIYKHQKWIAVSISALHMAVDLNTTLLEEPTVEQQEHTSFFLRGITINLLDDILLSSNERTASFVHMILIIENLFQRLSFIFRFYSFKLSSIIRAVQQQQDRRSSLRRGSTVLSGTSATVPEEEGGSDSSEEEEKKSHPDKAFYMTANQFWRFLCDAGVAGRPASPHELTPTLHRPAVFSIVEQVVFRAVSKNPSPASLAPIAKERSVGGGPGRGRTRQASVFSTTAAPGGKGGGGGGLGPVPLRDIKIAGKIRQTPHFARAVQEGRHVDIRAHRGTICMNLTQFIEALVRCAHCWQCMRSATRIPAVSQTSLQSSQQVTPQVSGRISAGRQQGEGSPSGPPPLTKLPNPPPFIAGVGATPNTSNTLQYESVHYKASLHPQVLQSFLSDYIIPKTLNVMSFHNPLQRAMRGYKVRHLLTELQDPLFALFARYSSPKEANGIRSALPPPFCRHVEAQLLSAQRADEIRRISRMNSVASFSQNSSNHGVHKQPPGIGPRDVGIVGVLTLEGVRNMAKELNWIRESCRITSLTLQHCFEEVLGDQPREGPVMFFSEFSVFLCAVAMYHIMDPTIPFYDKLEDFLTKKVLVD